MAGGQRNCVQGLRVEKSPKRDCKFGRESCDVPVRMIISILLRYKNYIK